MFDNGTPPLYSDVHVKVQIVEESRHPPVMAPLDVTVNSYLDDFPGAVVGRVTATDLDPYDVLTYSILGQAPHSFVGPPSTDLFEIDRAKGTVVALQGLDVGTYVLNVSVSDGKFVSFGEAKVNVRLVSEQLLGNAVIVRFAG